MAIGESLSTDVKPGSNSLLPYNIQTGDVQTAAFADGVEFRFSSLNDSGTYVGYGQLNNYSGGFIGSVSQFRGSSTPMAP